MEFAFVSVPHLFDLFRKHRTISTDSRRLPEGCIFFALQGETFDGNRFALDALEKGAAYAVVDDPALPEHPRLLRVADVLETLQVLATHHRRQFDIPVVAIGGSNGKTTTKELIAAVMGSHYPCHYTKGNLNNHIGVPLTLLEMPDQTEVAIIEMGTNQAGDIDLLCAIAEPTHGLLTNIGKEHLQGFGNLAGVKKAEGELYRYLAKHQGCIFLNRSEQHLTSMARYNRKIVSYEAAEVSLPTDTQHIGVALLDENPYLKVAFRSDPGDIYAVQSQLIGRHNFNNIMTAIALGIYFKVPPEKIKQAIEAYKPSNNRSQLVQIGSNTVFLDAYNANPSSMKPALETLHRLKSPLKVAILGDMLELGDDSAKEHTAMLRFAAKLGFDRLVLVGSEFGRTPFEKYKARHFPDALAAKSWFEAQQFDNATILLKGSRGIRLEKILNL